MKRHILVISFFIITVQIIACNPKNLWENNLTTNDVSSVKAASNTTIEITFKGDVEQASAEVPDNYTITGLTITNAKRDDNDFTRVLLTTSPQQNTEYSLIVTDVVMLNGRIVDTAKNPAKFMGDALLGIISVIVTSNTGVQVTFSENVGNGSDVAVNYVITGGSGCNVISAGVSGNIVNLTTDEQSEIAYVLTVNCVYDTSQTPNLIDPAKNQFSFNGDGRPELDSAYWVAIGDPLFVNHFYVKFSEDVNDGDALDHNNYSIVYIPTSTPLNVSSVTKINNSTYELTTDQQIDDTNNYSISATNIRDLSGHESETNPAQSILFNGKHCPYIVSIDPEATYPDSIIVTFSEVMDAGTRAVAGNYKINNTNPSSASLNGNDKVRLVFPFTFNLSTDYTLTVYNVTDGTGNFIQATDLAIQSPGNIYEFTTPPVWP